MSFRLAVFVLLIIGWLVSCKKAEEIKEGSRLKRVIYFTGTTLDSFIYDNQQRLIGVRHFGIGDYDNAITYNAQRQVSKVVYSYQGVDRYQSDFVYNAAGQVIKRVATSFAGFHDGNNSGYAYDSQGRLKADTTYNKQTGAILYYLTYTYDNKGNVVETESIDFTNLQNQGKTSYKFDSNRNPYKFDGNLLYYIRGGSRCLNKNNFTEMKPWWTTALLNQYEYQKNGLPTKINSTLPNGAKDAVKLEYW